MVHAPWDSIFVLLSLLSNYKKSWKQSPAPFSNFPTPKEQFIHIVRPPMLTQGKGLLIGPLYSPLAVLTVISVPLFHYHVTNTVSQRERLDLFWMISPGNYTFFRQKLIYEPVFICTVL